MKIVLTPKPSLLAGAVLLALASAGGAHAIQAQSSSEQVVFKTKAPVTGVALTQAEKAELKLAARQNQASARYIVILEDASLVKFAQTPQMQVKGGSQTEALLGTGENRRLNLQSVQAQEYGAFLQQKQASVSRQIEIAIPSAQLVQNYTTVLNGLVVETSDPEALIKLKSLPQVAQVYKSELRYPQMDISPQAIDIEGAWQAAGGAERAGEGIRIAVIDTGIRPENPFFAGTNLKAPSARAVDDYCALEEASFCTNKLITTRAIPPTFPIHKNEYLSPLDYDGHGTHVAGTAAGEQIVTHYNGAPVEISGIAPGAYLMAYKALYTQPNGKASGSDQMLVSALEAAVLDGADVINNSWGSGPGQDGTGSVYDHIFADLEAAGIVVVTAAGNDGPGEQTVGCPGCVESGITVAAANMGREFLNQVHYGQYSWVGTLGNGNFKVSKDIQGELVLAAELEGSSAIGCTPYSTSLADSIVYVERGECTFIEKAEHAQAAGAVALIVGNNESGVLNMDLTGVTLPAIALTQVDGRSLERAYKAGEIVTLGAAKAVIDREAKDRIASFSSRGPNGNSTFLKPDLSAPGYAILSATSPDTYGQNFSLNNGTSMATPQVAGAAAVLRALNPEWNAKQIKSVLMGTAKSNQIRDVQGNSYATPFVQGAGLVQVSAAQEATFAAYPSAIVKNGCRFTCEFEQTFENLTDEPQTLYIEVVSHGNDLTEYEWTVSGSKVENGFELVLPALGKKKVKGHVDSRYSDEGWFFSELQVRSAGIDQSFPVVISNDRADDARVLFSEVTSGEPSWGEELVVETHFSGSLDGKTNQLLIDLPEELPAGNIQVKHQSAEGKLTQEGKQIRWEGVFKPSDANSRLVSVSSPGGSLADLPEEMLLGEIQSFDCVISGCDDDPLLLTGLEQLGNIYFDGVGYDTLTLWPNGLLAFGEQTSGQTFINQKLPHPDRPNAVLAPLWADFILGGEYSEGDVYFAAVKFENKNYFVVEWRDAVWINSQGRAEIDQPYTFSVWLEFKEETPRMFFNYTEVPNIPAQATIGFEDRYGLQGVSYYYNNEAGSQRVQSGDALKVELLDSVSKVTVRYTLGLDEGRNFERATNWDQPLEIDLAEELEIRSLRALLNTEAINPQGYYEAFTPIRIEPVGAWTAEIVDLAAKGGRASVFNRTSIRFTPREDFSGVETISYRLFDQAGNKTQVYQIKVEVEGKPKSSKKWYQGHTNGIILMLLAMLALGRRRKMAY